MSSHAPRQMLPQHRVTAILVTHDGARWLPEVLEAIRGQIRPPDLLIAVDTGSVDATKAMLAAAVEARDIVGAARTDGFGAAVAAGVAHIGNLGPLPAPEPYRPYPLNAAELLGGDPDDADPPQVTYYYDDYAEIDEQYAAPHDEIPEDLPEPTAGADWLWLLHDDVAPETDALLRLIELAETAPSVAVLGPKVRDWDDPRLLVEVGITIDHSGRLNTGLERHEFDQGQHDAVRDVLAVGTAGMLIRRDVWDELGGFDPRLPIFRDDIDFGWRANAAGHRVVLAPASRVRHARASASGRRRIRCAVGRPSALDRRHSIAVVLANVSTVSLLWNGPHLLAGAVLRTVAFLLTRQVYAAADEIRAIGWNLARTGSLLAARSRRQPLRRVGSRQLRPLFAGRSARLRGYLEATGDWLSGGAADPALAPTDLGAEEIGDEPAEIGTTSRGSRVFAVVRQPVVALTLLLVALTLVADRGLFGPGRLLGGHLLPAPASAHDLWATYTSSWHDVSGGSATDAPAWIALLGALASVLFGKAWLAVDVLMLFALPLAALSAYFASRRVTGSRALRLWGAAAYAVLPPVTAAVAAGRLDVVVLAILLPCVASACYRAVLLDPADNGWRHAFVAGLALALAAAFVPVALAVAAALLLVGIGASALLARDRQRAALARRVVAAVAVLATAFAVLLPWSWRVAGSPRLLLTGLTPRPSVDALRGVDAMLLRPGGPAMPRAAIGVVLLLAALPALLRSQRTRRIAGVGAWSVAISAMSLAVLGTRTGTAAGWPGPALLVAGAALIAAVMIGATGGKKLLGRASFGWRQLTALLIAVLALVAPVFALGSWVARGAGDPLANRTVLALPRYIVAQGERQPGLRVLWLQPAGNTLRYTVTALRGGFIGADQLPAPAVVRRRLDVLVAALATPSGSDAAQALSTHAVRFVALPAPADAALADVLDAQPALTRERSDAASGVQLWRVIAPTGRVTLLSGAAAREARTERGPSLGTLRLDPPLVLLADALTGRYAVPAGEPGRLLVVSEYAGSPWHIHGAGPAAGGLKQVAVWGWATGVQVPQEAISVTVAPTRGGRRTGLVLQALALLVALVLAAPSVRRGDDEPAIAEVIGDEPPAPLEEPVGASA